MLPQPGGCHVLPCMIRNMGQINLAGFQSLKYMYYIHVIMIIKWFWFNLIPSWINKYTHYKVCVKLLIYSQISTHVPHWACDNLLELKLIHISKTGPRWVNIGSVRMDNKSIFLSFDNRFLLCWWLLHFSKSYLPQPGSYFYWPKTEMCTFQFWMEHCGIWNRCILWFVKLNYWDPIMTQVTH